ncbi:MAG TPA: hypothetical protein PLZ15_09255 [Melioribacteraceae bacterium]|nr:hypothetical protein [Melioribacteraceae bacterium]
MTQQDKSNYFKGLLILIGKDKNISENERRSLSELANILGFDRVFCDNAISELLENEYIIEDPPAFSNPDIARAFIIDGIKIAFSDHELHIFELNWLKSVADKNSLETQWCIDKYNEYQKDPGNADVFEVRKFLKNS